MKICKWRHPGRTGVQKNRPGNQVLRSHARLLPRPSLRKKQWTNVWILLKKKMEEQLGSIIKIVQTLSKSQKQQETGGVLASQIPVSQDNRPSGVREPVSEVTSPRGMQRPFISLDNNLDQEFESRRQENMQMQDDDMLSITPGQSKILLDFCQMTGMI